VAVVVVALAGVAAVGVCAGEHAASRSTERAACVTRARFMMCSPFPVGIPRALAVVGDALRLFGRSLIWGGMRRTTTTVAGLMLCFCACRGEPSATTTTTATATATTTTTTTATDARAPVLVAATQWSFDTDTAGTAPSAFSFGRTGDGRPGVWVVRPETDAPSAPHVLAQVDADATDNPFPSPS